MSEETSYDRVLYPGYPFPATHPSHLAVLAGLHGMQPAAPERCRVLELGCGDGANIIPMACQLPGSTFLGVDLSSRAIQSGNEVVAGLGLDNIVLQHRDITELADDGGEFDYIIAHGVFSWVPQPVRDKILDIFARSLAPQGIAYVSYNALPGCYLRDLARSMMLFHVRAVADAGQRVAQSRALLKALAEASGEKEIYGFILREQLSRIADTPDEVLLHDDLDEGSKAFFLYQVVEAAATRGLQYMTDAVLTRSGERGLTEQAQKMLAQIPQGEFIAREQYGDFLRGRAFRNTLLCRHDVALRREPGADHLRSCLFSSDARPVSDEVDLASGDVAEFKTREGDKLRVGHRLAKAAFVALGTAWPRQLTFSELGAEVASLMAGGAADLAALAAVLREGFEGGIVHVHRTSWGLTTRIDDKPVASRLARWQAGRGRLVTNLVHGAVIVDDALTTHLLMLLDGTRDVAALVAELRNFGAGQQDAPATPAEITPDSVAQKLAQFARLGLLEARNPS